MKFDDMENDMTNVFMRLKFVVHNIANAVLFCLVISEISCSLDKKGDHHLFLN